MASDIVVARQGRVAAAVKSKGRRKEAETHQFFLRSDWIPQWLGQKISRSEFFVSVFYLYLISIHSLTLSLLRSPLLNTLTCLPPNWGQIPGSRKHDTSLVALCSFRSRPLSPDSLRSNPLCYLIFAGQLVTLPPLVDFLSCPCPFCCTYLVFTHNLLMSCSYLLGNNAG